MVLKLLKISQIEISNMMLMQINVLYLDEMCFMMSSFMKVQIHFRSFSIALEDIPVDRTWRHKSNLTKRLLITHIITSCLVMSTHIKRSEHANIRSFAYYNLIALKRVRLKWQIRICVIVAI